MNIDFVPHLRCHSEYSLTHGMVRLAGDEEIGKLAAERNIAAMALTDFNNIYGAIPFYKSCIKYGVKPILGCHAKFIRDQDFQFSQTVLCENEIGFKNLSTLLSHAQIKSNGAIDCAELSKEKLNGLILLIGFESDLGNAVIHKPEFVDKYINQWISLLGKNNLAIEISFGGRQLENDVSYLLAELAAKNDLKVVATHPILFPNSDDYDAHEVKTCISNAWLLEDENRPQKYSHKQYFQSARQMKEIFKKWPEALFNAQEIAYRCNYNFGLNNSPQFPKLPNTKANQVASKLQEQAQAGLEKHLNNKVTKVYQERLDHELTVITDKGFADYFLIVADLVSFAKENNIPVGPGRGSGAGSLVAYSLGITAIDPIEYDLLFERFLNPERTSLPDFDIDFCKDRRDEIINHARDIYGDDCVAQVITFGSLKAKAVVRDVCRVLGMPYDQGDTFARLIPDELDITLDKAKKEVKDLQELINATDDNKRLWNFSLKLEKLPRQPSTHAAAIIIAPQPLVNYCPISAVGDDKKLRLVSQYDKDALESIGLIKFDILGLKNLTMLHMAEKLIIERHHTNTPFSLANIDLTDPKMFELYATGNTMGVFQCESAGMVDLIKKIVPKNLEDIAIAISLFRPGALNNEMDKKFIENRHNLHATHNQHPALQKILKTTFGAMVFQEQVMLIAQELAGFSLAEADTMRAAIGKKNPETMASLEQKFIAGCKGNLSENEAHHMFEDIKEFAGYGFNKSHAVAYALISLQTAYLKANYPAEFYASSLTTWTNEPKSLEALLKDAIKNNIQLIKPCINSSAENFSVVNKDSVRFGLASVRAVGNICAKAIVAEREHHGKFKSLDDFCIRLPSNTVNLRALDSLIGAGACDNLIDESANGVSYKRAKLSSDSQGAVENAEHVNRNVNQGQLFGGTESTPKITETSNVKPWRKKQLLIEEQKSLGTTLSGNFYDLISSFDNHFSDIENITNDQAGIWAGFVVNRISNARLRKQGREVFNISNNVTIIEVRVDNKNVFDIKLDSPGALVVVTGKVQNNNPEFPASINATKVQGLDQWLAENLDTIKVICKDKDMLNWCLENLSTKDQVNLNKTCKLLLDIKFNGTAIPINTRTKIHSDAEIINDLQKKYGSNLVDLKFAR